VERDERGRPVRRRPRRPAPPEEVGFPEPEHDQWSVEGEIERLGLLARGMRRRNHAPWVRVAVWVVTIALLLPLVLGVVSVVWGAVDG
jgi:hypothetical protein